jgi:hypothetical protein
MRKKLLRFLRIAPLVLFFASVASAQTTGTIIGVVTDASTGKPVPGAVIIASSPNLQGQQTAVTDANGAYRITLLPPGDYTLLVQLGGYKDAQRSDISIRLDKTIRANLAMVPEAVQMEEQVVRTGAAPVVNIGAAESGAVVAREFVANVPVGRTVEQVSAVVPTAQTDLYGVGFAGAQSPENAYILDGMNVGDPIYGTFGSNTNTDFAQPSLLTNFIQELDVKTGGFSPEYGHATGGVLNMITKSGSNEFHGSAFANYAPRFLWESASPVAGRAGEAVAFRSLPSEGAYNLDLGFELGGPILKDKLWFYAGFAPIVAQGRTERFLRSNTLQDDFATPEEVAANCGSQIPDALGRCQRADGTFVQSRIANSGSIYDTGRTTYQALGKLTYLLDENNNFTLSSYAMPSTVSDFNPNSSASRSLVDAKDNIFDVVGRYAGKFLDKRLVVEAVAGYHSTSSKSDPNAYQRDTPSFRMLENVAVSSFENVPGGCTDLERCPVNRYIFGGYDFMNDLSADRLAGRVSGSYLFEGFGSHNAKVGLDLERSDYTITKSYSGGGRYDVVPSDGVMDRARGYGLVTKGVGGFARDLNGFTAFDSIGTDSYTTNTALFAQDSWQLPVANVTLNYGLRWEAQTMDNKTRDVKGFNINNNWAPRLQAIWDFTGTGRGKVAATWGRFFYPIPLDMGDRAFGGETSVDYTVPTACGGLQASLDANGGLGDPALFTNPKAVRTPSAPGAGDCAIVENAAGSSGSPIPWVAVQVGSQTPASPDLQGVYVDQFGGQFEYELLSDLSVGVEYNGRRQGQVIEDMSSDDGITYFIANPGYSKPFTANGVTYNSKQVDTYDSGTGRTVTVNFPSPQRSYDGFTLFLRKNFSRNWQAAASYTYSSLRGNLAGPFRPETGQLDPGVTSEYDLASLTANRNGYLPGDVPHQVKLYGSYTFNVNPRFNATVGGAYTGLSGNPANALGAHDIYGPGESFVLQRGSAGRSPFIHRVDLRGGLEYIVKPPYAVHFSLDVFNLLNSQEIASLDENYTFNAVQPISGLKCTSSAAGSSNPVAQLQSDCPDIQFLKRNNGRIADVNPNWGRAAATTTAFQAPLSVRFGVALSF